MTREGQLQHNGHTVYVSKALLDTGAEEANYMGGLLADRFYGEIEREPCRHPVRLGDGKTIVTCTEIVTVDVALYASDGSLQAPISTSFYVMPALGDQIIIGLPEILGNYYEIFTSILEEARANRPKARLDRLAQLYDRCKEQLCSEQPNMRLLKAYGNEAKAIGSWYAKHKHRVLSDPKVTKSLTSDETGTSREVAHSATYGSVLVSDSVEEMCAVIEDLKNFPMGAVLDAWSKPIQNCPEEDETPDPLAFGPDVLHYMETSVEDARKEYLDLIETQVTPEMRAAQPRVVDILTSPAALETFSPSQWNGLKIPPVSFEVKGDMPSSMVTKALSLIHI